MHLVFASAELLPTELPRPPDEPVAASDPARRLGSRARVDVGQPQSVGRRGKLLGKVMPLQHTAVSAATP